MISATFFQLYHQALLEVGECHFSEKCSPEMYVHMSFAGNIDTCSMIDTYLVILKRSILNFRLHLSQDISGYNDSYEMCCLLVK